MILVVQCSFVACPLILVLFYFTFHFVVFFLKKCFLWSNSWMKPVSAGAELVLISRFKTCSFGAISDIRDGFRFMLDKWRYDGIFDIHHFIPLQSDSISFPLCIVFLRLIVCLVQISFFLFTSSSIDKWTKINLFGFFLNIFYPLGKKCRQIQWVYILIYIENM